MKLIRLLSAATVLAVLLFAADINGAWKYSFTTPDGQTREGTLNLKADGEKVTGSVVSARGETQIKEGTLKGNDLTFTVIRNFGGEDRTFTYKGKIEGNTINFHVTAGEREYDMKATRQ